MWTTIIPSYILVYKVRGKFCAGLAIEMKKLFNRLESTIFQFSSFWKSAVARSSERQSKQSTEMENYGGQPWIRGRHLMMMGCTNKSIFFTVKFRFEYLIRKFCRICQILIARVCFLYWKQELYAYTALLCLLLKLYIEAMQ